MPTGRAPAPGWLIELEGRPRGAEGPTVEIVEILGEPGRQYYRVRWDDGHQSIFYLSSRARFRRPVRHRAAQVARTA